MKPLFLDTTVQVDRVLKEKPPKLQAPIEALLSEFDYLVACSYSRLEFKRAVIQKLALTLDYLCEEQSFWGALQRANATGARRPRLAATLISIAAWIGLQINGQIEVTLGEDSDRQLAMRAESTIRIQILFLWKRFEKSVDSITDKTRCMRATEGPRKRRNGTFDVRIPETRCKSKECDNANFFQENLPTLKRVRDRLEQLMIQANGQNRLTTELQRSLSKLRAAIQNPSPLYDYKECAGIGDIWIHLESLAAGIKDFATTNYKESEVLCPVLGLNMRKPSEIQTGE